MRHPLAVSTWGEEEKEAACAVIRSGYTTMGERVKAFEREFARFHGCEYAVMVNSGSSANLLMVAALVYTERLKRGSRVAVPMVSWSTTYAPLTQFGMRLVFVDVDDSLNIDPAKIPKVDAIFGVNLLGNPMDFDRLPNCLLIEDNCESLGATYKGKKAGTFGVMGSHSLFYSHHISAMEGGVITTDDEELYRMLLMLRAHGWTRDLPDYNGEGFHDPFTFMVPGYSVRPTEIQGAIGLEQLKKLPGFLDARRRNAETYRRLFGAQREVGESSWFGFAIFDPERDEKLPRIREHFDVRPIVAGNILRQPMLYYMECEAGDSTYADIVHDQGFYIGNHHTDCEGALMHLKGIL